MRARRITVLVAAISLLTALAVGNTVRAQAASGSAHGDVELKKVAETYRSLRAQKAADGANSSKEEFTDFRGLYHQQMTILGQALGKPPTSRQDVLNLMGLPDWAGLATDPHNPARLIVGEKGGLTSGNYYIMAYQWRGWHDFLYFRLNGDAVVATAWCYAGE